MPLEHLTKQMAVNDGGGSRKKKDETTQVRPVYEVAGTSPAYDSAFPTYTSPTAGAAYKYTASRPTFNWSQSAPTWRWDDSVRPGEFTYKDAPTYTNAYSDQINSLVDSILNRQAFSYDHQQDPLYQQYAETYGRNGRQAMNDTYAQMAARTGGLASSYAGVAAQGAYNQYMQALNDKIPELYQIAYQMYNNEGQNMRNNLSMIQNLESTDYGRYLDALGQYNTDRNLAYNLWGDAMDQYNTDRNFSYGQYADALQQYNNDRNFAYNQYADALSQYNTDRGFDYGVWSDALDRQEAAARAAYNAKVDAYNASMKAAQAQQPTQNGFNVKDAAAGGVVGSQKTAPRAADDYPYDRVNSRGVYQVDAKTGAIAGTPPLGAVQVTSNPLVNSGFSFTWNGKTYTSKDQLQKAISRTPLTDMEAKLLSQQLAAYGISIK